MDLVDRLQDLAAKIRKQRELIRTEEAAKNAFVLPFLATLGYDVFNPSEVIPEYVADVGTKKGEKVDYAILRDGKIIMLVECKQSCDKLDPQHASQLYRYFSVTDARIAVLTDGCTYRFFTDLDKPNTMDLKPFMEIDVLDLEEPLIPELKKLTKAEFDLDQIVDVAGELKYTREIKRILAQELASPSPDLVKLLAGQVYSGRFTESVREQFTSIVKRAFVQFIRDRINERLQSALSTDSAAEEVPAPQAGHEEERGEGGDQERRIETTEEELEGYHIVKAIVAELVDPARVAHRDTLSYMGVLLDDNNRKPICRLHFNRSQKYVGLFDGEKSEERIPIGNLNEIYQLGERLRATVRRYEDGGA
jgi:predicted type IV restriction endonuclease